MSTKREKLTLTVEKRKITGRKVKTLRREGILPANIYGRNVKSLAVQVDLKSFLPILKEAGETGLVQLKVAGEKNLRPVLIHNVQFHPVDDQPLHADFYQVDLKEKVTAKIPIELIGESPAVKEKVGILIQPLSEVEVEALPADLPEKISLDISSLKAVDDTITVANLKFPEGVKVLTEEGQILAKIEPPAKEEITSPPEEIPAEEVTEEEAPAEKAEEEKVPKKEESEKEKLEETEEKPKKEQ